MGFRFIYLKDYEDEKVNISIYECDCGFHFGIDNTYIDQVEPVWFRCPNCLEMHYVCDDQQGGVLS